MQRRVRDYLVRKKVSNDEKLEEDFGKNLGNDSESLKNALSYTVIIDFFDVAK